MSEAREAIEANILTTLQGMTIAAGFSLPKDLGLVTREILDYDDTSGKRPAAVIQFPDMRSELIGIGGIYDSQLEGRVIFYFDVDLNGALPATYANAYIHAAREILQRDESRGGVAYHTGTYFDPTALLWKAGQAFEATMSFRVQFMHERD
jgi:hypothetical protein